MSPQYTAPRAKQSFEDRFWSKVDTSGDCWVWTAERTKDGYGRFALHGRSRRAHRVAYLLCIGQIPDGLFVCHRCDNPPCCNPAHLFLGTDLDNVNDSITKGRHTRGERTGSAKLCEADVIDIRYFYATGMSITRLAPLYGIAVRTARSIVARETWKHVP